MRGSCENGYLALKEGADGTSSYLKDVDWSRTRAYTFGLAGVYINQKGREAEGIVDPREARALKRELAAKLSGLYDEQRARPAVRQAWPSDSLYTGPYLDAAPDVIVGYAEGYRASWDSAVGKVTAARVRRQRQRRGAAIIAWTRIWFRACCFPTGKSRRRTRGSKTWRPLRWICSASSRRPTWRASRCSSRNGARYSTRSRHEGGGWPARRPRLLLTSACANHATRAAGKRMIVLGIDGMDPVFVETHFAALPNLNRLRQQGSFRRLATTIPPQSPVAWSSVITGMDPGGHGIFDFVHRNPATRMPVSSMAETTEPTPFAVHRTVPDSLVRRRCAQPARGPGLLANARRTRRTLEGHPHARQLSARRMRGRIARRHGYAGHDRLLRHVFVLYRRSGGKAGQGAGRADRARRLAQRRVRISRSPVRPTRCAATTRRPRSP